MQEAKIGERRASAHPTKAFFVRMLTRDITLEDCILDLIDNSVDAAWASAGETPATLEPGEQLTGLEIVISISDTGFSIRDNCGGISLDHAADYAFTFGRDDMTGSANDFSVGVYGIGMKRAVFKLGKTVTIRSTALDNEPFKVPIDVESWMRDEKPDWDFDIEPDSPLPSPGVEIDVSELTSETSTAFADPAFTSNLRSTIARDYMLPLMQGLQIRVNKKPVAGWKLSLRSSREFAPMRQKYNEGEVTIEVIAGMMASPSDGDTARTTESRSGWYVLCNGRVVVAADRSTTTVWGDGRAPAWHPQYEGFLGIALFTSRDPSKLPMTTTKNGVDVSSSLYKRAVVRMLEPTRAWIDYTNARKNMREEARVKEEQTEPTPIGSVRSRKNVKLPKGVSGPRDANINYAVSVDRLRALAKAFGKSTMSYRDVGIRSFEFAEKRLVDPG